MVKGELYGDVLADDLSWRIIGTKKRVAGVTMGM
jgi:hypothetical protein